MTIGRGVAKSGMVSGGFALLLQKKRDIVS